jgi:hypothetical protein
MRFELFALLFAVFSLVVSIANLLFVISRDRD